MPVTRATVARMTGAAHADRRPERRRSPATAERIDAEKWLVRKITLRWRAIVTRATISSVMVHCPCARKTTRSPEIIISDEPPRIAPVSSTLSPGTGRYCCVAHPPAPRNANTRSTSRSPLEGAKAVAAVTATCTNAATATSSPYGVDARTTAPLRDDRSKAGSATKLARPADAGLPLRRSPQSGPLLGYVVGRYECREAIRDAFQLGAT